MQPHIPKELHDRLMDLRLSLNLSIKVMAAAAGIAPGTLDRVLMAGKPTSDRVVYALGKMLKRHENGEIEWKGRPADGAVPSAGR